MSLLLRSKSKTQYFRVLAVAITRLCIGKVVLFPVFCCFVTSSPAVSPARRQLDDVFDKFSRQKDDKSKSVVLTVAELEKRSQKPTKKNIIQHAQFAHRARGNTINDLGLSVHNLVR